MDPHAALRTGLIPGGGPLWDWPWWLARASRVWQCMARLDYAGALQCSLGSTPAEDGGNFPSMRRRLERRSRSSTPRSRAWLAASRCCLVKQDRRRAVRERSRFRSAYNVHGPLLDGSAGRPRDRMRQSALSIITTSCCVPEDFEYHDVLGAQQAPGIQQLSRSGPGFLTRDGC